MAEKPNILYIMVDQQRYDCIGFSRDYPVQTPNIDALASEGVWFSNAYTHIPLCCPARQSFIAGRRPEAFGALWNYDLGPKMSAISPDEYSWARSLGAQGYRNAYLGKWHVHPQLDPTAFGYDEYVSDDEYGAFRQRMYPELKYNNGLHLEEGEQLSSWYGSTDPVPLEHSRTHWLAARTIEKIESFAAEGQPWHIRMEFTEPHLPCNPSRPFSDMYDPGDIPPWRSFGDNFENKPYIQKQALYNWNVEHFTWDDWAPIVARYYAIISQMDDAVGRVLDALKRLGLENDTLVVFTSDHGDMCGGHRMMDKHYVLYEDVVKVPFIVKWPGGARSGAVSDAFVYNLLDIPPTLLELAGVEPPAELHGRSLLPLLRGEPADDWRKEVVATYNGQQFGLYTQRMIRTDGWKYIWNTTDVDELYDLTNDPDELVNAIHRPELQPRVAELRRRLYDVLLREGDTLVDNPWMKEQLLNGRKL